MSEDRLHDIKSQIRVRMLGASNASVVPLDKAISIASVECARLFAEVERLQGLNHAQHYEYERLERRIATLREALAVGIHHDNCETDDECTWVDMARKALAPAQEDKRQQAGDSVKGGCEVPMLGGEPWEDYRRYEDD